MVFVGFNFEYLCREISTSNYFDIDIGQHLHDYIEKTDV